MKKLMKQKKITATLSAILIALTLVGLNTDQAIAQGKAGKRAKVRAGSGLHLEDISLGVSGAKVKPQAKRRSPASFTVDIGTSEKIRLQTARARRKTTKRK
jgi:hypothetical protein